MKVPHESNQVNMSNLSNQSNEHDSSSGASRVDGYQPFNDGSVLTVPRRLVNISPELNHFKYLAFFPHTDLFGEACVSVYNGRIGRSSSHRLIRCGSMSEAVDWMEDKVSEKTSNRGYVPAVGSSCLLRSQDARSLLERRYVGERVELEIELLDSEGETGDRCESQLDLFRGMPQFNCLESQNERQIVSLTEYRQERDAEARSNVFLAELLLENEEYLKIGFELYRRDVFTVGHLRSKKNKFISLSGGITMKRASEFRVFVERKVANLVNPEKYISISAE